MTENLAEPLHRYASIQPNALAISAGGDAWSYAKTAKVAAALADRFTRVRRTGRIGILASRSIAACLGILGTAWAGLTYVPLSLKLPEERLIELLTTLELDAIVVDQRGARLISPSVAEYLPPLLILSADAKLSNPVTGRNVVHLSDVSETVGGEPSQIDADNIAYIEFTSGTTGKPKGVMVPALAVNNYLKVMQDWSGITCTDRAAETCDITFDLSVHNMFLTWHGGASLYVMSAIQMLQPSRFIRDNAITCWLSVPSIISLMRKSNMLKPASLCSLRISMFCGEPLPIGAAQSWLEAAPNSRVENIYGPTEATIACLRQVVEAPIAVTAERGIVAIGSAFPGMRVAIFDKQQRRVGTGVPGEIALSGVQLAKGYFGLAQLTQERFPVIDGMQWYLTGDLGMEDENGIFHHLGRLDNQVKILGNRVELEEVEMHLRAASKSDEVAAVAWPIEHGSATGIVAFVVCSKLSTEEIQASVAGKLASYMMPSKLHLMDALPLNGNGKVDRSALARLLSQGFVGEKPEATLQSANERVHLASSLHNGHRLDEASALQG